MSHKDELRTFDKVSPISYREPNGHLRHTSVVGDHMLYYVDDDGMILCPMCARWIDQCRKVYDSGNSIVAFGVNWNDPNFRCGECREYIDMACLDQPGSTDGVTVIGSVISYDAHTVGLTWGEVSA